MKKKILFIFKFSILYLIQIKNQEFKIDFTTSKLINKNNTFSPD
jgi:hypothetical protein